MKYINNYNFYKLLKTKPIHIDDGKHNIWKSIKIAWLFGYSKDLVGSVNQNPWRKDGILAFYLIDTWNIDLFSI